MSKHDPADIVAKVVALVLLFLGATAVLTATAWVLDVDVSAVQAFGAVVSTYWVVMIVRIAWEGL